MKRARVIFGKRDQNACLLQRRFGILVRRVPDEQEPREIVVVIRNAGFQNVQTPIP